MIFYMIGILDWPYDLPLMFAGFLLMTWWALVVGLIVAALSERYEMVGHVWPPMAYVYILLSGFPYMAYWLPSALRNLALTLNPPLLVYEIIRGGLWPEI